MSHWGEDEWPMAHFNDTNARAIAEANAEADRDIALAKVISWAVFWVAWVFLIAVLIWWF